MIPFDVTWGGLSIIGIILAVIGFLVNKGWDLWVDRRARRRERILDWHRDTIKLFGKVISIGRRIRRFRRPREQLLDNLIDETVQLEEKVYSLPIWIEMRVDPKVRHQAQVAAGMAYHLAHIPQPDQDEDSIAGIMYHLSEVMDLIEADTDVQVEKAIEITGEIEYSNDIDMTDEEAKQILEEFEAEAKHKMENWEQMTVDEVMELPWEKVDEIISEDEREKLAEHCINTYYEKALIEKPKNARKALRKSENAFA